MKLLLEPVIQDLDRLCTDSLAVTFPNGPVNYKAKLVLATFDLPAKSSVLNCKQFNGKFGCSVCYHPGLRLPNGARVYLPVAYRERTHAEVVSAAEKAETEHHAVKGILGMSPLATIIDVVDAVLVDYIYCCLEGVMKLLMKYWFTSSYHGNPFYLGRNLSEIVSNFL